MTKLGEIQKLKSLLDNGEIADEEFQRLKKAILLNADSNSSSAERSSPQSTGIVELTVSSEVPINTRYVTASGTFIKASVNYAVASFVTSFISASIFFYVLVAVLVSISKGYSWKISGEDFGGILLFFFFAILSFIFWVKSLKSLHKAGHMLESSRLIKTQ